MELALELNAAIERAASPYDSHPPAAKRIEWVQEIAGQAPPSHDDDQEAWSLFENRQQIEERLTAELRELVRLRTGQDIPAA